jgi:hypothetical protein
VAVAKIGLGLKLNQHLPFYLAKIPETPCSRQKNEEEKCDKFLGLSWNVKNESKSLMKRKAKVVKFIQSPKN